MCPYPAAAKPGPANFMDERLYVRILTQARQAGPPRRLALMLQNEPLLDPCLATRVRQAKAILGPGTRVMTVTNGSLLTPERADELTAAGMDSIEISLDAFRPETYARIRPGTDFHTVVSNAQAMLARPSRPRVTVRFLRQRDNAAEEAEFVRCWESQGARVHLMGLSSRLGDVRAFEQLHVPNPQASQAYARAMLGRFVPRCLSPFSALTVLWDGRVQLCCQDWGPRDVVGDLARQSLAEVWNGETMNHYRHLLWSWRTEASAVCRDCSIISIQSGAED